MMLACHSCFSYPGGCTTKAMHSLWQHSSPIWWKADGRDLCSDPCASFFGLSFWGTVWICNVGWPRWQSVQISNQNESVDANCLTKIVNRLHRIWLVHCIHMCLNWQGAGPRLSNRKVNECLLWINVLITTPLDHSMAATMRMAMVSWVLISARFEWIDWQTMEEGTLGLDLDFVIEQDGLRINIVSIIFNMLNPLPTLQMHSIFSRWTWSQYALLIFLHAHSIWLSLVPPPEPPSNLELDHCANAIPASLWNSFSC